MFHEYFVFYNDKQEHFIIIRYSSTMLDSYGYLYIIIIIKLKVEQSNSNRSVPANTCMLM